MRITEFFQVLPALLFAMVLVTLFGPTLVTVTLAIGVVSWTGTARLTRAEFMRLRDLEFVSAPARHRRRQRPHLIWGDPAQRAAAADRVGHAGDRRRPSCSRRGRQLPGPGRPQPDELGPDDRLRTATTCSTCWWAVTFPGAAIFLTVLAVSLVGDGLNDALNPKLQRSADDARPLLKVDRSAASSSRPAAARRWCSTVSNFDVHRRRDARRWSANRAAARA